MKLSSISRVGLVFMTSVLSTSPLSFSFAADVTGASASPERFNVKAYFIYANAVSRDVLSRLKSDERKSEKSGPIDFLAVFGWIESDDTEPNVTFNPDDKSLSVVASDVRVLMTSSDKIETKGNELTISHSDDEPDVGYKLLSAPSIVTIAGESAEIRCGTDSTQYFEKCGDGTFELKTLDPFVGVAVNIRIQASKNNVAESKFDCTIRSISKREKLPDVALDIGKPVISEVKREFRKAFPLGKWFFSSIPAPDNSGNLLIFITVSSPQD